MTAKKTSLASALLDAQRTIHAVGKDARNSYSKYDYTSAETMIAACRDVLLESGLTLQRTSSEILDMGYRNIPSKDGGETQMAVAKIHMVFKLSHAESGESDEFIMDYPAQERIGTPLDKAVSASMTTALSYMLRDILNIPRVDKESIELDNIDDSQFRGRPANVSREPSPKELEHKKFQAANRAIRDRVVPILKEAGVKKAEQTEAIYRFVTGGQFGTEHTSCDNAAFAEVASGLESQAAQLKKDGKPLSELINLALGEEVAA